jgi:hypothetical protein
MLAAEAGRPAVPALAAAGGLTVVDVPGWVATALALATPALALTDPEADTEGCGGTPAAVATPGSAATAGTNGGAAAWAVATPGLAVNAIAG